MKNGKIRSLLCGGVLLLLLFASGCSSVVNAHRQKEDMMTEYLAGRGEGAITVLDEKLKEPRWYNSSVVNTGDEIMWRLEAGSMNLVLNRNDRAIFHLSQAEKLLAENDARAIVNLRKVGAEGAVLFTNSNALPYNAFARDRIMLPVLKAFAYLGRGDEKGFDVELFSMRANQQRIQDVYKEYFAAENEALEKAKAENADAAQSSDQKSILDNPRNKELSSHIEETKKVAHRGYKNYLNPLTIFLSGYGYLRRNDPENALVDFKRLYEAMPQSALAKRYYATALRSRGKIVPPELAQTASLDFSPGRSSVLVIFANGRSAAFKQIALYIPVILPGYVTVAATAWPVCEYYQAPYRHLEIRAADKKLTTSPVADMDGIISREYSDRLPGSITRIVLSTVVKETASYIATRAAYQAHPLAGIGTAIGMSIYKIAMNTADTRTWEILPKEFQIVEFAMPPEREFTIAPDGNSPVTVKIPPAAQSAIVYVNAPSQAAFACRVYPLYTK